MISAAILWKTCDRKLRTENTYFKATEMNEEGSKKKIYKCHQFSFVVTVVIYSYNNN